MTLYPTQTAPITNSHAPVLPADKARAQELYEQVKGTPLEQEYRTVSGRHAQKNDSRAQYLAFLTDIEGMFAAPEPVSAPVPPVAPEIAPQSDVPTAPPVITAPVPTDEDDEPEGPNVEQEDEGDDQENAAEEEAEAEGTDEAEGEDAEHESAPTPTTVSQPAPAAPVAPLTHSGLIAQLCGMLADGGELTLQLMRVGGQVTVGIFPKPHPGESAAQPLILTEAPDWLDQHLTQAISQTDGYAQARRDAFTVCQDAAKKQQAANKKAAEAKLAAKSPSTTPKARTSKIILNAEEGTTLSGKLGGQDVNLVIGENDLAAGTLEVTATHPFYGEVKKTLTTYSARTHDFREQQGATVTLAVTPESAAVTATKDDTTLALHGETFLPGGAWVIKAEAAGYEAATQRVTIKPGKATVIELKLNEAEPSLF